MNFNAWMPLQNTTEKNYNYSAKKDDKTSRTAQNTAKEADKTWKSLQTGMSRR